MPAPAMPAPSPSEEARTEKLARAARRGDLESFRRLYELIAPSLYAWVRLRMPPLLREHLEVEDVLQEVWCRGLGALDRFDPDQREFRRWIFRVAKNVMLEALRRAQRMERLQGAGGETERLRALEQVPDDVTTVTRRLVRDETLQNFLRRVETLDAHERELVVYCGLEELPYREVATRLGIQREAVAKRWQRLRRRLRVPV